MEVEGPQEIGSDSGDPQECGERIAGSERYDLSEIFVFRFHRVMSEGEVGDPESEELDGSGYEKGIVVLGRLDEAFRVFIEIGRWRSLREKPRENSENPKDLRKGFVVFSFLSDVGDDPDRSGFVRFSFSIDSPLAERSDIDESSGRTFFPEEADFSVSFGEYGIEPLSVTDFLSREDDPKSNEHA